MPNARIPRLVTALLAFAAIPAGAAQECTVRTGPFKNPLVELYTSEGCSSCPPADRWLSALTPSPTQPHVVPIAFHVSYWDDLGWKDVYASPRFTERQRALAATAGRANVYTPQVILDGRDFPAWHGPRAASALEGLAKQPARATLEVTRAIDAGAVTVRVHADVPGKANPDLVVVMALTEDKLGSRVTAGENRGETLRHDHVAREVVSQPLRPGHEYQARFQPMPAAKLANAHVVAFVQDRRTGEVLQAASACEGT